MSQNDNGCELGPSRHLGHVVNWIQISTRSDSQMSQTKGLFHQGAYPKCGLS